jgi:hypothetical protein
MISKTLKSAAFALIFSTWGASAATVEFFQDFDNQGKSYKFTNFTFDYSTTFTEFEARDSYTGEIIDVDVDVVPWTITGTLSILVKSWNSRALQSQTLSPANFVGKNQYEQFFNLSNGLIATVIFNSFYSYYTGIENISFGDDSNISSWAVQTDDPFNGTNWNLDSNVFDSLSVDPGGVYMVYGDGFFSATNRGTWSKLPNPLPSLVPLPASAPLVAMALALLGWLGRKKRNTGSLA